MARKKNGQHADMKRARRSRVREHRRLRREMQRLQYETAPPSDPQGST